ncbi:hypothetical protein [Aulosira sp. FACHB-615]|uniref:hypothetical protein n=1 Tax=Aulosira sp. FACHB-615 TaxID=2692777 RepID=UPI0016851DF2|nr:hypothetical protein [Aulosira sp. FACHB-615]MBD2488992.1 hypothetical protein [Aulosira sp. FACHB-615]
MEIAMSEYQYLRMLAFFEFSRKMAEQCEPIQQQINEALKIGDWERASELENQRSSIAADIFWERVRAEDIIRWLELDSDLRSRGDSTYPDVFEKISAGFPIAEGMRI